MLYGISLLYGATGSLYLHDIAAEFSVIVGESTEVSGLAFAALPAMLLILAGLGFKASLAPFYQWAPDTYDGSPTPVATYLSTASKAAAFAVLARFFIVAMASFEVNWGTGPGCFQHHHHDDGQSSRAATGQRQAHDRIQFRGPGRLHTDGVGCRDFHPRQAR